MTRIMIDPGHVGSYYNASPVVPGYYESEMAWKLSLKLKAALEEYNGIEAMLTREKDEDPELTARGRMAKGYDLFLSIHSNAAASEVPDAPWIITLAPDGKTGIDEISREIGGVLGPVISGVMGVSAPYYYTKQVDFDRDGNGYLDDEYYGVLFGAKSVGVPGVILEHSFHTNERAARWLMSDSNLTALAEAEAAAIAEFYEKEKKEDMNNTEKEGLRDLLRRVTKLEKESEHSKKKYNWTTACPEWARSTVHKLTQKGVLKGDENGQLGLSEDMCRLLVILDRAGAFD